MEYNMIPDSSSDTVVLDGNQFCSSSRVIELKVKPHGWIQWKTTDVCMDTHCKCGHHGHIDADFFYFYICPECKTKYIVGQIVQLIEMTSEEMIERSDDEFQTDTC